VHIAFLNPQGNFDAENSHLTEHPDFGGQLIYVRELALAMAAQGAKVDILTRQIIDPDWPEFSRSEDDFGEAVGRVRILRLPFGGPQFLPKEDLWPVLPDFVSAIRNFYGDSLPDYFTAHYADGGFAAAQLRAGNGAGFTFTGHSLGAQKMDKLKVSRANHAALESRFHFSKRIEAERLAMQLADRVVTSTTAEAREQYAHPLYAGAAPTDPSGFAVIPPGINGRIFHPELERDPPDRRVVQPGFFDRPQVIVSSRLDAKKNIAGVVEAFAISRDLTDRAGLVICIRGMDDPWSEIDRLKDEERAVLGPILDRLDSAGLRSSVRFLNIGSQQALAGTYRSLAALGSVFALPSLVEPFGLAPIEAAACGLAVAATKNGGPSEVFGQGGGVLFDPEDPEDIASGLLEALSQAPALQTKALESIVPNYTWEQTAARYLDVIEQGIDRPRPPISEPGPLDAGPRIRRWLGIA
jgi:sucrose-phosphate synthase